MQEREPNAGTESDDAVFKRWVLMDAPRIYIVTAILTSTFVSILFLGTTDLIAVADPNPVLFLFSSLIAGNLTLISIIPSVNQLALSRELASESEFEDRMSSIQDFRRTAEEHTEAMTSPPDPADFLRVLLQSIADGARALQTLDGDSNRTARNDIKAIASGIIQQAEPSVTRLADAQFGSFDVVSTALAYDSGYQIYQINRLKHEYSEQLSDEQIETLDELVERLKLFGIARSYFKSLYLQRALAKVTRIVPSIGLVSLLTSGFTLLVFGARPGTTLPPESLLLLVSVTAALGLAPLSVLLAFAPRVTAVVRRGVSTGPFSVAAVGEPDERQGESE